MSFARDGYQVLAEPLDRGVCLAMLVNLYGWRQWDRSLFLTEDEFNADPQFKGVNPKPGRNLIDRLVSPNPDVLDGKIVCGVPQDEIPAWVKEKAKEMRVANLGAFVKPQYRDVTYFSGIDWHQDIIDWPDREPDFVTLYVYLHDVRIGQAPLQVAPGSHLKGAEPFPHAEPAETFTLCGQAGTMAVWHPFTLHKTDPADTLRLSLRFLLKRDLSSINRRIVGPMSLAVTRSDLDELGRALA